VDDDQDRGADHKRRDNDGDSPHRPICKLTSDAAATVIGICVSLLVMLTGAFLFIVCFGLLMVLLHIWIHVQTS
jgi:hypothetical protein